jgi:hypothetical protein
LLLDLVAVLVFATIGRRNHAVGVSVAGVLATAWPFLVGAVTGWLVVRAWRRPLAETPTGVAAWLGAVVVGMLLRRLDGQGTALSFVVVATVVLAVLVLGWRLVVRLAGRP